MRKINMLWPLLALFMGSSCGEKKVFNQESEIRFEKIITGGNDGRKLIPKNKYVDMSTVAITKGARLETVCSGTIIGISHIITAAHCVYDTKTQTIKDDLTIVPGFHMSGNYKPTSRFFISRYYILKNYMEDLSYNGYTTYGASKDIAIIQVKEFTGQPYLDDVTIKIDIGDSSELKLKGMKFNVRGYSAGAGETLDSQYYQKDLCESKGQRYNYTAMLHDCDTNEGTSGMGFVYDRPKDDPRGKNVLLAVHTGGASSKGLNTAAFIHKDVLKEIKDKILLFETKDLFHFEAFDAPKNTSKGAYVGYQFRNNCSDGVELQVLYQNLDGNDYVYEPMNLKAGELKIFPKKTHSTSIKYYAKKANGSLENRKDVTYTVKGKKLSFETRSFDNKFQDNEIVLCD